MPSLSEQFESHRPALAPSDPQYVPALVDGILEAARQSGVSDVHLVPDEAGLRMLWRMDGVLHHVNHFPRDVRTNIVARLKVLAELLTYRVDVPQEGRIRDADTDVEMRVSTFPTLYGEKAVVRLFVGSGRFRLLSELGFPPDLTDELRRSLNETGGAILITGPAGSGKTTTAYACLRELAESSAGGRSLVSLEDPIEAIVPGVAQSHIKPAAGFDYETGLKSLLRQDPEVMLVGEIRDRGTAELVLQASLTGHLVLTTFHAGSAAEAISRLLDMGIEPYQLRSGILGVLNQRLVRRLCRCAVPTDELISRLGLDVSRAFDPKGCPDCGGTGYRERLAVVEYLQPRMPSLHQAILSRHDAHDLENRAAEAGMTTRWQQAAQLVETGATSATEIRRVLGFR